MKNRRRFLQANLLASGAGILGAPRLIGLPAVGSSPSHYRAAVIGHTGAGDYGHGYDQIFRGLDNVSVVAVADPDAAGRARAAERSGAARQYADYRELLDREKPDLVSVAPRHPAGHRAMILAAVEVCRGVFCEKPLTETLVEADDVVEAARRRGVRIVVAHNRRWTREFMMTRQLLRQGFAGSVRQVNIHGKQDTRAGGEDLMVLGTHDFDLMRCYFGDPLWCFAAVTVGGRDATGADVRSGREPIRVAGDSIRATFAFPGNAIVHWESVTAPDDWNTRAIRAERWAFEILGTRRIIGCQSGVGFGCLDSPFLLQPGAGLRWEPLPEPAAWDWPEHERHPIRSLIQAIETGSETVCTGMDGRWAVEMVAAIYESHRRRARVELPLTNRADPLSAF